MRHATSRLLTCQHSANKYSPTFLVSPHSAAISSLLSPPLVASLLPVFGILIHANPPTSAGDLHAIKRSSAELNCNRAHCSEVYGNGGEVRCNLVNAAQLLRDRFGEFATNCGMSVGVVCYVLYSCGNSVGLPCLRLGCVL